MKAWARAELAFSLHGEARARRARGERVIDASLGVLLDDSGRPVTLPTVAQGLAELPPEAWLPYPAVAGEPAFLEAVRRALAPSGLAETGEVVPTLGATGAVRTAMATCLQRGDVVVTTSHHFGAYADIAREQERGLVTFSMFDGDGRLDGRALATALARVEQGGRRALLLINDPCQNPTGYSMTSRDWETVADVVALHARRALVGVLVDLAYVDLAPSHWRWPAAFERLGRATDLLLAWSASKSLLAYGLRTGALLVAGRRAARRRALAEAAARSGRAAWGACPRGGMLVVGRLLGDDSAARAVERERGQARVLLAARQSRFRAEATRRGLVLAAEADGFFATVLAPAAGASATALRAGGVFLLASAGGLRAALCAVPTAELPRLVEAMARQIATARRANSSGDSAAVRVAS